MQKWNMPMNKVQKVGEKNAYICLVTMFPPAATVLKCLKWFIFWFYYLAFFAKCYGVLGSEGVLARFQDLKIQDFGSFFIDSAVFLYFYS